MDSNVPVNADAQRPPAAARPTLIGRRLLLRGTNMRQSIRFVFLCVVLTGCAVSAVAEVMSVEGPSAVISDHGYPIDDTKSALFFIRAIDGKPVRTSLAATREATRANKGPGFHPVSKFLEHKIPVHTVVVRIVATHVTALYVQELGLRFSSDFLSIEGDVKFSPQAGGEYVVNGDLAPGGSFVCIADARNGKCISEKVRQE